MNIHRIRGWLRFHKKYLTHNASLFTFWYKQQRLLVLWNREPLRLFLLYGSVWGWHSRHRAQAKHNLLLQRYRRKRDYVEKGQEINSVRTAPPVKSIEGRWRDLRGLDNIVHCPLESCRQHCIQIPKKIKVNPRMVAGVKKRKPWWSHVPWPRTPRCWPIWAFVFCHQCQPYQRCVLCKPLRIRETSFLTSQTLKLAPSEIKAGMKAESMQLLKRNWVYLQGHLQQWYFN